MVIHSHDGLDELTTIGPNRISHLRPDGNVHTFELDAKELGIENKQPKSMTGGSIERNLEMLQNILSEKSEGAQTDTVLLNAAAAMATEDGDIATKLVEARTALNNGAALRTLNDLVQVSQELASQK
jgi:anthranilate phosphoribosyltransferase